MPTMEGRPCRECRHYLAGRTSRELAAEHQIPASTLEVRLWRLRARLRRQPVLRRAWEMLAA